MSVKLLIVTSKYRPQICGVGDYSAFLVNYLRGLGYSVDIFTSGSEEGYKAEAGVFRCSNWSFNTVRSLTQWVCEEDYTHVLLQYTPMGYSKKGAFPPIALLPFRIRKICPQCRVITTLHELFYVTRSSEIARIPRNLSIGTAQRILLLAVICGSSGILVTTKERHLFLKRLGSLLRWQNQGNISEIPVGSNIEPILFKASEQKELREKHGLKGKLVLGTFSKSSDPGMVLAALAASRDAGMDTYLVAIGSDHTYFRQGAKKLYETLSPYIICTGKVSPQEVSQYLQLMNVYLLPLLDGVSTRRGTLLAALAHGLPIVGTYGRSTDLWMRETKAFRLTPSGDKATFARAVQEVLRSGQQQHALRRDALALFHQRFTWEAIAKGYENVIKVLS